MRIQLTNQLFGAPLRELAAWQPSLIVRDLNVEPTKTLSCLTASRLVSGLICKHAGLLLLLLVLGAGLLARESGLAANRRDFMVGCPLCAAAKRR